MAAHAVSDRENRRLRDVAVLVLASTVALVGCGRPGQANDRLRSVRHHELVARGASTDFGHLEAFRGSGGRFRLQRQDLDDVSVTNIHQSPGSCDDRLTLPQLSGLPAGREDDGAIGRAHVGEDDGCAELAQLDVRARDLLLWRRHPDQSRHLPVDDARTARTATDIGDGVEPHDGAPDAEAVKLLRVNVERVEVVGMNGLVETSSPGGSGGGQLDAGRLLGRGQRCRLDQGRGFERGCRPRRAAILLRAAPRCPRGRRATA